MSSQGKNHCSPNCKTCNLVAFIVRYHSARRFRSDFFCDTGAALPHFDNCVVRPVLTFLLQKQTPAKASALLYRSRPALTSQAVNNNIQ
jgi:hypothetical protein